MTPARRVVALLAEALKADPPEGFSRSEIVAFFREYGGALEEQLVPMLSDRRADEADPVTPTQRLAANLKAIRLLEQLGGRLATEQERAVLAQYSGWGGLSLRKAEHRIPPAWMPSREGLVHEYYTPTRVWQAVGELLQPERDRLVEETGRTRLTALEPSAGIGRALRAFRVEDGWDLDWTAVELSSTSAALLRALFPRLRLHEGPFEGWRGGPFDLVISNPPYGPRPHLDQDPDFKKLKRAYLYFVERGVSLLERGGVGAFLIPTGLLTGQSREMARARERILSRGHLLGAWRLPSQSPNNDPRDVAYDGFVVDLVVFGGRGGVLSAPLDSDRSIIEGLYYHEFPAHILGREIEGGDWEPGQPKPRRGYQVEGVFEGFGPWEARPWDHGEVRDSERARKSRGGVVRAVVVPATELAGYLDQAVRLGLRADAWLAALGRQERAAVDGWAELVGDLVAWRQANGNPHRDAELKLLARDGVTGAQRFLAVWQSDGDLLPGLKEQPEVEARYQGAWTLPAVADWLYRQQGGRLTLDELAGWWAASTERPRPTRSEIREALENGWCLDGADWTSLVPEGRYYEGYLWLKHDAAAARASTDPWAARQWARLKTLIGWRPGVEILDSTLPIDAWLPLSLVSEWLTAATGTTRELVRQDGLLQVSGRWYSDLNNTDKRRTPGLSRDFLSFIGWANADRGLWNPEREEVEDPETKKKKREPVDEARDKQVAAWVQHFQTWMSDPARLETLEHAYNRQIRGWAPINWPVEPVPLARWSDEVVLRPHQNRGVHLVRAARTGLLAFDVGLGKTYTGLAILACARQEGWARRPVVLVPNSLVWKWYRDFARCLPDFRVAVIGSERRIMTRGPRKGRLVAEPDSAQDRAAKWTAFAAGEYDAVILAYSALSRTQMNPRFVEDYVDQTAALRRAIALSLTAQDEEEQSAKGVKGKGKNDKTDKSSAKPTERREAEEQARVRAWVGDVLSPPKNWVYDPGIDWHALGVDMLIVDEAQNYKNLFSSSQVGAKSDRGETARAWALEVRCASVRAHSGGGGVVLLSATPAKNAPEEFYTMYHYLRPSIWREVGIDNHESFVARYGQIQNKMVPDAGGQRLVQRKVFTGWRNIEELQGVVYRWGDFRVAEGVGVSLPTAVRRNHQVEPTRAQLAELADLYTELAEIEDKLRLLAAMSGKTDTAAQIRYNLEKKRGLALKIYLTYLHPSLPGIGADREAIAAATPADGPKLVACADEVLATAATACPAEGEECCLNCGHIIFCDNVAVHYWMRDLLIERGIPASEIAILNAVEAKDLEYRQQVVEGFNGVGCPDDDVYTPPRFNVVIANAVAYEGMDLQRRTCAIHHLDVPWEPATLQQRNGRGVRQGNLFGEITLHYYFVAGSNEIHRIDRIERKRGWMAALIEGAGRATNTTQEEDLDEAGLEDLALAHAPPEVRERIQRGRLEAAAAERERKRDEGRAAANKHLHRMAGLWGAARRERDPERAQELARTAAAALADMTVYYPGDWWPYDWHARAAKLRDGDVFVPERGPPLPVGEWVELDDQVYEVSALGMSRDKTRKGEVLVPGVWLRAVNDARMEFLAENEEDLDTRITLEVTPPDERYVEERLHYALTPRDPWNWGRSNWVHLAPARQIRWWDLIAPGQQDFEIAADLYPHTAEDVQVPAEVRGRLVLLGRVDQQLARLPTGGSLVAPTPIGWARFLELAEASEERWSRLNAAAKWWFGAYYPKRRADKSAEQSATQAAA